MLYGIQRAEQDRLVRGGYGVRVLVSYGSAFCHAFSTLSTGGFSTRNASVGAFGSAYIDLVILVFMFMGGTSFTLHFWLLRGRTSQYLRNEEFRMFALVALVAALTVCGFILLQGEHTTATALRLASFQVVSILTSTGFGTADYLQWGAGPQVILYSLMFLGGCAGSTGGGIKMLRVLVLSKHSLRELRRELHPQDGSCRRTSSCECSASSCSSCRSTSSSPSWWR